MKQCVPQKHFRGLEETCKKEQGNLMNLVLNNYWAQFAAGTDVSSW